MRLGRRREDREREENQSRFSALEKLCEHLPASYKPQWIAASLADPVRRCEMFVGVFWLAAFWRTRLLSIRSRIRQNAAPFSSERISA
jgi:hypothetical protein